MTQQTSPFLEGKYGWNFGESGWNPGMDENLLKFSFLFDRNVDSIAASLPAAVNGQAHYLTTDNRLYFAVGTIYYSSPVPKWFTIVVRSTGQMHQFNGTSLVQIDSPAQLDSRLDAVELTVSTLGTAAFEDVAFFATQAELDVAVANAAAYTDALEASLAAPTGSTLVGWTRASETDVITTASQMLNTLPSSVWEYADLVTDRPNSNPETWDWEPAISGAIADSVKLLSFSKGTYPLRTNVTIPDTMSLEFSRGSMLLIESGTTLTINGGIEAGPYQIFSVSGAVNGSPNIHHAYAEWFGAKADDVLINNAPIITAALNFHSNVKLLRGAYYLSSAIILRYGSILSGVSTLTFTGYDDTALVQTADFPVLQPDTGAGRIVIENLIIRGNNSGTQQDGILLPCHGSNSTFRNLWIRNMGRHGFHAAGTAATGLDLINVSSVKIEECSGYGVRLALGGGVGFNTSLFEQVECTKNNSGGFYINSAESNTFLRCHSFQNSNPTLAQCHGFYIDSTTTNQKFINCWAESDGEIDNIDPTHTSAGFYIAGGSRHDFDACYTFSSAIGMRIAGGNGISVRNPQFHTATFASSADIIIDAAATNCLVSDYLQRNAADPVVVFSTSSKVDMVADLPTSGRIPYNASMRRGARGKSHCYSQGSATAFEYNTQVDGTATNNYVTWTAFNNVRIGDNILIPGAGTAGGGLFSQVVSVDVQLQRLYLNNTVITTVVGAVAATVIAGVQSETFAAGVTGGDIPGAWQVGDIVWNTTTDISNTDGWRCSAAGSPGTWKQMAALVP